MSDERRKRQQQRTGVAEAKPPSRKYLTWGAVIVVVAAAYFAYWYYINHRYDNFAKCLASKQVKMYGLYWCPHCLDQKDMFGKAFRYVPYQECAIPDSHEMADACKAAGAKNFPSWQFQPGGPLQEGVEPLDELSSKTGCSLP
ncbi:MAG TPA: hypothetical protein VFO39_10485 [Candidatus Sulfotelmatobacter sp.]|nr:hypothetical protein [Candidatus Sulfotelmatobacter sp.]